uniref:hypothetical protein n=1 Tax=Psammodictyon constrictum TaxID=515483 RepID=UPI001EF9CDF1|nr:hypothetical protein MKU01_pgp097 [Psammodictyon constrictum]ULD16396.1 hypothetical protein [Psammodictyon constrictum]
MKVTKEKKKNVSRSKLFGIVINPKFDEIIDWKSMSNLEMENKLKELKFPDRFVMTDILNKIQLQNVNKNYTGIEDFMGQLETGTETSIPHYQLAIKANSLCTKKKVLEALEKEIEGHINVQIQFNLDDMKNYCSKETNFISEQYSGKIYKHQWRMDFLERKPQLKEVLDNPYIWQKFVRRELLDNLPDDRTVDWIIDPIGNTGKSSFARAYVSEIPIDGILMKIDNLDRMELTLIKKIENYRMKYYKDPKVIFFDFPRASDPSKIISATALMEDAKSGHLETTFGDKHKEIEISDVHIVVLSNNAPDLSVLSVDRWRLWRLGGEQYENIIWPCKISPYLKKVSRRAWNIRWTLSIRNLSLEELRSLKQYELISFDESWLEKEGDNLERFGETTQYIKDLVTNMYNSPNYIKIQAMQFMESIDQDSIVDFTLKMT